VRGPTVPFSSVKRIEPGVRGLKFQSGTVGGESIKDLGNKRKSRSSRA